MDDNYEGFKKAILKMANINLDAYKEKQMRRRIESLITKHGYKTYDEYIAALKASKELFDEFINYMTINVSEFYRNPEQWDYLEKKVFPDLISKFGHGIKIWSAACSTGDEPYSLVMLLSKFLPLNQIKIIATDIDETVMAKAKAGLYKGVSLAGLPDVFKKKFFTQVGSDAYQISDEVKRCVEFRKLDLLKDRYIDNCHLILCRNVVIYFTDEAKDEIYKKFNQSLVKDGVLFIGSTEQISNYRAIGFTSQKSFFYQKTN